jgi:uncharacterized protein YqgC (DUF456 family)
MIATAVNVLVGLLLVLGLVGSIVPFLPGTLLILAGSFIYALFNDFAALGTSRLMVLAGLTALAYAIDYVAGAFGVKRFGGSRWAMYGAILGAVVGLFFGPLGLILGTVFGAVIAEWIRSRDIEAGMRSGVGSALGMVLGTVAKLCVAVTMVGLFLWWTWLS